MATKTSLISKVTNQDVEREIVSRLLDRPALVKEIYGFIKPEDFNAVAECITIYTQLCENFENGVEWSLISLLDQLKNKGQKVGIADFVNPQTTTLGQFNELVDRLKESSLKRTLLVNAEELSSNEIYILEKSPDEIVTEQLSFLSNLRLSRNREEGMDSLLAAHRKLMEERIKGTSPRIPTGFRELDNYLAGGFQRQDFIVIGARPSIGKTSLALTLSYNAARAGKKTLFISVEMRGQDIIDRLLAFQTGASCTRISRGDLDKNIMEQGYAALRKLPLTIYELYNATSGEVYSVASKEKYKNGLDLVVVDYMQVLQDVPGAGNERSNLNSIARTFKMTARLLDVALISPSQVTRKAENGDGGMPGMHQLRESGNIEADADVIFLMSRDKNDVRETPDTTKLMLAKNRKGETGLTTIHFNKITTRFDE